MGDSMKICIDKKYVEKYLESWEKRHDEWVVSFLAKTIFSNATTLSGIKDDLKHYISNDWRGAFAFFVDRTSYQGGVRSDSTNCKIATYLFEKIISLPEEFSNDSMEKLNEVVSYEKLNNIFPTLWKHDLTRLESISNYLIKAEEKNMTKIVLSKVDEDHDILKFLEKTFLQVGPKTSSFYMKFITWLFELELLPITIDQHVYRSLKKYNLLKFENNESAKTIILQIGEELKISPIFIETALYEESWLKSNKKSMACN